MNTLENIDIKTLATTNNNSIFSMLYSADLISQAVIVLLAIVSIWSWAIILDKIFTFRHLRNKISNFETIFWAGSVLDQLYDNVRRSIDNPLASIFISAMNECKRGDNKKIYSNSSLKIGLRERISQSMYLVRDREIERLEKNLAFLAVAGSTSTFVGLFGTVWGIMHSFQSIATSQNTTLAVVAPGIAEALLATAVGLLAAIPAVVFYSYLVTQITSINNKIDDFIGELSTILSRAIDEEKI
jgi:biopolymer transport protein TolQ